MAATRQLRDLLAADQEPPERGDAVRNRALLLAAARRLIAERGPDAVTMDDIASAAGVGKGTVFRRFGSRAGLMLVILDEDERHFQHALMFGPPPLGPGAPPLQRLLSYGRARLTFVDNHLAVLCDAARDPTTRYMAPAMVQRTHVRLLLADANTTGDLDTQADALLALLDAAYVAHETHDRGRPLGALADAWESVARKLCGR